MGMRYDMFKFLNPPTVYNKICYLNIQRRMLDGEEDGFNIIINCNFRVPLRTIVLQLIKKSLGSGLIWYSDWLAKIFVVICYTEVVQDLLTKITHPPVPKSPTL